MKSLRLAAVVAAAVLMTDTYYIAAAAAPSYMAASSAGAVPTPAGSRWNTRLQGKVVDEAGQPVPDVMVTAQQPGEPEIRSGKTNKKGEWRLNDLADGQWNIELTKEGLEPIRQTIEIRDERAAPLNVTMTKPKPDPAVALNAELQRAVALAQSGKFAEAREICQGLVTANPELVQCDAFIGQMYAAENQIPKAIEHVKMAIGKDPNNINTRLLLADLLNESGDKVEAKKILDAIDITQVKDPFSFLNAGIAMINEAKGAAAEAKGMEAAEWLTKLAAQFPTHNDIIYYRGRAYVAAGKLDLAKADFEKFIAVAPNSKEAPEAKKLLDLMVKK